MYCRITKMNPKKAKNCTAIEVAPAPKPRRRNRRGSSSGSSRRSSQATKAVISASASPKALSVSGSLEAGSVELRIRGDACGGDQGDDAKRTAEREDRIPGEQLEQGSRDQQAEKGARAGNPGPDGNRPVALAGREDVGDDRQRRRHDRRGAEAHHRPDGDQRARVVDQQRRGGGGRVRSQAPKQHRAAPEPVAQRAGEQEQAREDHGV